MFNLHNWVWTEAAELMGHDGLLTVRGLFAILVRSVLAGTEMNTIRQGMEPCKHAFIVRPRRESQRLRNTGIRSFCGDQLSGRTARRYGQACARTSRICGRSGALMLAGPMSDPSGEKSDGMSMLVCARNRSKRRAALPRMTRCTSQVRETLCCAVG
jgi:hypothetical protein